MKPTQEQVIAWAREAGVTTSLFVVDGKDSNYYRLFERFAALAYEAGRKDENEACAKFIEDCDPSDHLAATIAAAIRARGNND